MSWPAALLWVLVILAAASNGPGFIYLVMITGIFGSLQMMPGDGGGANMLPQSACAAAFVCKVVMQRGNVLRGLAAALDPMRLGLFTAFTVYAVFTALILPRIFAGMIEVVPVSAFRYGTDVLKPGAGNITQSCYMVLSYATMLAFCVIGTQPAVQRHYRLGLLWGSAGLIVTGIVDLILYQLGLGGLLDPFRTATYAMLTDVEAEGAKRVVGLMPEASVYGGACVNALAGLIFLRPLYQRGTEQFVVVVTIFLLMLMIALSTSSGSYVGFAVLMAVYGIDLLCRLMKGDGPRSDRTVTEVALLVGATFAVFAAFVLKPSLFDPVIQMVDKMVFQKTSSASYVERSLWTRVGWHAFLDSGGLGVGLGSIRVSNWTISILGSTGFFGALLMFGFIAQQLLMSPRRASPEARVFATATKLSIIPLLTMYQLGGTIPDIGIPASIALGLLAAQYTNSDSARQPVARAERTRLAAVPDSRPLLDAR